MVALTVSVGPELMLVVQITGEDQGQPWPSRTQVEKARCPVLPPSLKLSREHNDIPMGSLWLWEQRRCEELAAKTGTCDCESWELGVKTSSQGSTEGGVMRPVPALSAPSAFVCSSPCSFRDRRSPFNLIDILCLFPEAVVPTFIFIYKNLCPLSDLSWKSDPAQEMATHSRNPKLTP